MDNIKSCTDLSQSKTLSKILRSESADMYYELIMTDDHDAHYRIPQFRRDTQKIDSTDIPCWSLAALLGSLPLIEGFRPIIDLDINLIRYEGNYRDELCFNESNLIDACVAMIIKLYELDLL